MLFADLLSLYLVISVLARDFLQSGGIAWLVAMLARRQLPWGGESHRSALHHDFLVHIYVYVHTENNLLVTKLIGG